MYFYLSLGSNIKPKNNAVKILKLLIYEFGEIIVLPFIYTEPFIADNRSDFLQPFLNSIAIIKTDKTTDEVKKITNLIEVDLGRDKTSELSSLQDRVADIDILTSSKQLNLSLLKNRDEPYLLQVINATKNECCVLEKYGLPPIYGPTAINFDTSSGHIFIVNKIDSSLKYR